MNAKSGKVTMSLRIIPNIYLYKSTVLYLTPYKMWRLKTLRVSFYHVVILLWSHTVAIFYL